MSGFVAGLALALLAGPAVAEAPDARAAPVAVPEPGPVPAELAASRTVPLAGEPAVVVDAWLGDVPLDERVVPELAASDRIDDAVAARLADTLRARLHRELIARLEDVAENGPAELVEVSYGLGDPKPEDDDERDFVDSIVRTEAAAFFPGAEMSPEDVLALWGSEEFRKRSSGRIVSVRIVDGLYCVETKGVGPFLDPMNSCARLEELLQPTLCCQHSQVVTNGGEDGFQRVFFKESVKTVIRRPDGLWVHYLNYSRTKGLGGISKRIGRGKVKGAQEDLFKELRKEFGGAQTD